MSTYARFMHLFAQVISSVSLDNRSRLVENLQPNANWVFAPHKVESRLLAVNVAEMSAFASSLRLPVITFDEVLSAAIRARIAEPA